VFCRERRKRFSSSQQKLLETCRNTLCFPWQQQMALAAPAKIVLVCISHAENVQYSFISFQNLLKCFQ
jgi:hypothetical protein